MWPDESQIVLLSVACVSFVSSLFCIISTTQNARHSYNTSPINAWKKYPYSQLTVYCALLYTQCALPSAHCSVLTNHCSIAHCSQLTHNAQFTIHNSFSTTNDDNVLCFTPFHIFDQQVDEHDTWWVASFSCACRVCFVSSLICLAIFIQQPSNQRVKKNLHLTINRTAPYSPLNIYYSSLTTHSITHYFLFIAQSYLLTVLAHNSQLTTYCSLFIAHHWQLSIDHYPLLTTHH